MQVQVNNRKFLVGWMYINPKLETLLSFSEISPEEARKMKKSELCQKLRVNQLPLPDKVKCIIKDEKGEVIIESTITRHVYDNHNKELARKYSLHRALNQVWPSRTPENLTIKKGIWDSYLNRPRHKMETRHLENA